MNAHYDSIRGRIESDWQRKQDQFELTVKIPANTTATVYLPARSPDSITETDQPLEKVAGVKFVRMEGDRAVITVESGRFHFSSSLSR